MTRQPPHASARLDRARTAVGAMLVGSGLLASMLGTVLRPGALAALPAEACQIGTTVQVMAPELRLGAATGQRCDATFAPPWQPLADPATRYRVIRRAGGELPLRPPGTAPLVPAPAGGHFVAFSVLSEEIGDSVEPTPDAPFDLVERVRGARVGVETVDAARRCDRWLFGRWFCGPSDWNYVGPSQVTVRGRSERCLWLHPVEGGDLVVRYDGVPGDRQLRGRMALADAAADNEAGVPVHFEVRAWPVGQDRPDAATYTRDHANRRGWSSWRLDLPEAAALSVELRVASTDVGQRHFCVTGATRAAARAEDADSPPLAPDDDAASQDPGALDGSGAAEASGAAGMRPSPPRVPRERERAPGRMLLDRAQRGETGPEGGR